MNELDISSSFDLLGQNSKFLRKFRKSRSKKTIFFKISAQKGNKHLAKMQYLRIGIETFLQPPAKIWPPCYFKLVQNFGVCGPSRCKIGLRVRSRRMGLEIWILQPKYLGGVVSKD